MSKYLRLTFSDANGVKRSIRIRDPKDNLTASDVQNFMNQIISSNAVLTKAGAVIANALSASTTDSTVIWEAQ